LEGERDIYLHSEGEQENKEMKRCKSEKKESEDRWTSLNEMFIQIKEETRIKESHCIT
jgi:hypothetical protein